MTARLHLRGAERADFTHRVARIGARDDVEAARLLAELDAAGLTDDAAQLRRGLATGNAYALDDAAEALADVRGGA